MGESPHHGTSDTESQAQKSSSYPSENHYMAHNQIQTKSGNKLYENNFTCNMLITI